MHRLIKIRLMRDLERLEESMRFWRDDWPRLSGHQTTFRPPADIYENAEGFIVRLEVAGVAEDDLSITLAGQELLIRGERRLVRPEGMKRFIHHEIVYGAFERSFHLPVALDLQGVRAGYANGILEVVLPRQVPQARRIPVREGNAEGE